MATAESPPLNQVKDDRPAVRARDRQRARAIRVAAAVKAAYLLDVARR